EQLGFDSFITDFGVGGCTNFLDGVNYGSSGAGILDETGSLSGELFTMNIQLYNHKITVSRIGKQLGSDEVAKKYLSQCIYVTDMGHNDYLNNYFLDIPTTAARCMPSNTLQHPNELDDNSCAYKLNEDIQIFNTKLQTLIRELDGKYEDAAFTYINSYEIDSDKTNEAFKFTRESCCNVMASGGVPCKSLTIPCANRSEYVYWDGAHFTEAKAWNFGKRAYKRQSSRDAYPYDISELVQLKLHDNDGDIVNHAQL
ncbi:hypothetical protein OIU85_003800, partial [Salix viminalis]